MQSQSDMVYMKPIRQKRMETELEALTVAMEIQAAAAQQGSPNRHGKQTRMKNELEPWFRVLNPDVGLSYHLHVKSNQFKMHMAEYSHNHKSHVKVLKPQGICNIE